MVDLKQLLISHYEQYPQMEIRDAIKFLHQSCMGPGHLIVDEDAAMRRLEAEWNTLPDNCSTEMGTPIGNGLSCMVCLIERWRECIELTYRISSMYVVPSALTELDTTTRSV